MAACYIKSKKFCKSKHNRGLAVLNILIIISFISLSFFYIIQTNSLVSCNYQMRKHSQKIKELESEGQMLEMEIAQWQSPANLEELVDSLKMIEVGGVVYLGEEKAMAIKE